MRNIRTRYVLAFDSSCDRCADISHAVEAVSGGRLETLPLTHPDVREWRGRQWGPNAPWVPTLVRHRGDDVRCWSGAAMVRPFVRGLGARVALRVLEALGELSRQRCRAPWERARVSAARVPVRPRLLRWAAGGAALVTLALAGRTPGLARSDHALAREWVETNRDRLPRDYDAFVSHPLVRRRLVFAELPPLARRDLWLEHLRRYERAHPHLTAAQREVVDLARRTLSDVLVFRDGLDPIRERELRGLAVSAFGTEEAHALLATLGPDEPDPDGAAHAGKGRCGAWEPCLSKGCRELPFTCGTAWAYTRDGIRVRAEPAG
ncbi:hypothetical protein GCM10007079_19740 [Nocardiopsis terrae]|uniref:Thioredoxin n=1 Tax=Nocardiopsis terrae TaxID=372655 RepID=A0ABR9HHA2_9ACTN|nr:bacteriocin fulvocin C-related protein [Nocardiopsis terrae]MBE1458409.1 hypothetical protein [Nocardiopsis terrae]GHC80647.1 hypothetical protein GCM10007079_19740 [Nocardiopsis terrae]